MIFVLPNRSSIYPRTPNTHRTRTDFLLFLGAILPLTSAQSTAPTVTAVCRDGYSWMSNEEGQGPCTVAAYLQASCLSGNWTVVGLPDSTTYNGPSYDQANICSCSSIVYSTISACGGCQTGIWKTWNDWITNCDASLVTAGRYAATIPNTTSVPMWAFNNPTSTGTFNITLAQETAEKHQPDVRGTDGNLSEKDKNSTGKLVGIIVGSVAGALAILGALAGGVAYVLYTRRKRYQAFASSSSVDVTAPTFHTVDHLMRQSDETLAPSPPLRYFPGYVITPYTNSEESSGPSSDIRSTGATGGHLTSPTSLNAPSNLAWSPIRLYDPEDPSTFPTGNLSTLTGISHDHNASSAQHPLVSTVMPRVAVATVE
ncbi:hypothetical protein BOTBODRAFT_29593 [Botryobasidium botryosum FD-172 SS1]|uniref:Uncharacterized protein n=1 Tax=Botryobasidium botryosum (strain FD-172 SS1) TaxID=930990 RepID=A0A067MR87_BOTB1|nr:hypothetical protein BOTBODRAFT_29593 [Botryobasidium botryosum FD-172 SS1]